MPGVPVLAVGWGALGVSLSGPPLSFSMVLHPLGSLASVSSHSGWCLKVQIWKLQSLLREKPESHIASLLLTDPSDSRGGDMDGGKYWCSQLF